MQAIILLVAAGTLYGVGAMLLVPPLISGRTGNLQTRILLAFSAKFVVGVGWLLLVWKVLGWSTTLSAFGMATAYLLALIAVTLTVANLLNRRAG